VAEHEINDEVFVFSRSQALYLLRDSACAVSPAVILSGKSDGVCSMVVPIIVGKVCAEPNV
jgi:hypothetical protein